MVLLGLSAMAHAPGERQITAEPALSNQAFAVVEAYLNSPGDDRKDSDILHLAHILLNAILNEYQHLRLGFEKDIALAAWACRNLLELDVYIQYILTVRLQCQAIQRPYHD